MAEELDDERPEAARRIILQAEHLVVISGAWMSEDGGIATFRGMGSSGDWGILHIPSIKCTM